MNPIISGPCASIVPDPFGGRRLKAPILPPPAVPQAAPAPPLAPLATPADFEGRFAAAAEDLHLALRLHRERRRRVDAIDARRPLPGLKRARLLATRAADRYYDAADRVAAMIRSLTGNEFVPFADLSIEDRDLAHGGWAVVECRGVAYSLDRSGHFVILRPATLTVRLGMGDAR